LLQNPQKYNLAANAAKSLCFSTLSASLLAEILHCSSSAVLPLLQQQRQRNHLCPLVLSESL
jgi:hypothetical protein